MKASHCLVCRAVLDAATGVENGNCATPGSPTVCLYCGHIMIFADDLTLREPTADESAALAQDWRIAAIKHAIRAGRH